MAVGSAFRGAFGGPELEEEDRCVFVGGLRVAIVFVAWKFRGCVCGDLPLLIWGGPVSELFLAAFVSMPLVSWAPLKQHREKPDMSMNKSKHVMIFNRSVRGFVYYVHIFYWGIKYQMQSN